MPANGKCNLTRHLKG